MRNIICTFALLDNNPELLTGMKKFKINSIIFISVIAVIFCCNVFYLVKLYESIREDVEREVMTALADTDIDDMWERSERAMQAARANGKDIITPEETTDYDSQHGTVSGSIDENGDFVTNTVKDDGDVSQHRSPLARGRSYTNQMMKAMSQQMHRAMDKYYGYDLRITDSIFSERLADRQIYPDFAAIEIVDGRDSLLLGNDKLKDGTGGGYDVFRLCFNPDNGWIYRASVTPLTRHIISQMRGVIVTLFLLMAAMACAFRYLMHTVSQLRTIEEMKDDFVGNMTHELKTPIAIAYSANDALLNYDTSNDQEKKVAYLSIAMKQLRLLGELVENILAVSMERRKSMTLRPEKIDLAKLAREIAADQRMRGEKDITIEVEAQENVTATADRGHLSNVLNNLIDNAIKYSNDPVDIRIKITSDSIEVADNGIGIPSRSVPYVFDKFYRVAHGNRQDVRGYGIGLYYVRQVLGKMGWSIAVRSEEGVGSVFTIRMDEE